MERLRPEAGAVLRGKVVQLEVEDLRDRRRCVRPDLVDGAYAGRFLRDLRERLESWDGTE